MKHFSQIVTDLLASQHFSEQDFADQLQVPVEDVISWKKGMSVPNEDTMERMSRWYGIDEKTLKKSAALREVHQGVAVAEKSVQATSGKLLGLATAVFVTIYSWTKAGQELTIIFSIVGIIILIFSIRSLLMPSQPILASDKGFVIRYSKKRSVFIPYDDVTAIDYRQYRNKYHKLSFGRIIIRTNSTSHGIGDIADVIRTSESMYATLANHSSNFRSHSEDQDYQ